MRRTVKSSRVWRLPEVRYEYVSVDPLTFVYCVPRGQLRASEILKSIAVPGLTFCPE